MQRVTLKLITRAKTSEETKLEFDSKPVTHDVYYLYKAVVKQKQESQKPCLSLY